MRDESRSLSLTMMSRYCWRFSSLVTRPDCSISPNIRTSASGVFSSWLTFATNSLFSADIRRSLSAAKRMVATPSTMTPQERTTITSSSIARLRTRAVSSSLALGETCTRQP